MATRESLAPIAKAVGPSALQETLKKAKLKASAEKWEDDEPNYTEIEVPYTNILKNL